MQTPADLQRAPIAGTGSQPRKSHHLFGSVYGDGYLMGVENGWTQVEVLLLAAANANLI
jgi:hypothetical protein